MLNFFIAVALALIFYFMEYLFYKWNKKYTKRMISENEEYEEIVPLVHMNLVYRNAAILAFAIAISIVFPVEVSVMALFILLFSALIFYPKISKKK